jgi:threonylcarbamoyladenosine tRNA methylthiotransferase CDKAL1
MADVDIEDLHVDQDVPTARAAAKALVRPCSSGSSSSQAGGKGSAPASSQVPGTQAIWVKTFGCSHNVSDAEYMMGQLQEYGYRCGLPEAAAAVCGMLLLPYARAATASIPKQRCSGVD